MSHRLTIRSGRWLGMGAGLSRGHYLPADRLADICPGRDTSFGLDKAKAEHIRATALLAAAGS